MPLMTQDPELSASVGLAVPPAASGLSPSLSPEPGSLCHTQDKVPPSGRHPFSFFRLSVFLHSDNNLTMWKQAKQTSLRGRVTQSEHAS